MLHLILLLPFLFCANTTFKARGSRYNFPNFNENGFQVAAFDFGIKNDDVFLQMRKIIKEGFQWQTGFQFKSSEFLYFYVQGLHIYEFTSEEAKIYAKEKIFYYNNAPFDSDWFIPINKLVGWAKYKRKSIYYADGRIDYGLTSEEAKIYAEKKENYIFRCKNELMEFPWSKDVCFPKYQSKAELEFLKKKKEEEAAELERKNKEIAEGLKQKKQLEEAAKKEAARLKKQQEEENLLQQQKIEEAARIKKLQEEQKRKEEAAKKEAERLEQENIRIQKLKEAAKDEAAKALYQAELKDNQKKLDDAKNERQLAYYQQMEYQDKLSENEKEALQISKQQELTLEEVTGQNEGLRQLNEAEQDKLAREAANNEAIEDANIAIAEIAEKLDEIEEALKGRTTKAPSFKKDLWEKLTFKWNKTDTIIFFSCNGLVAIWWIFFKKKKKGKK